jgi:two-component system cell cycle response regulator DivK
MSTVQDTVQDSEAGSPVRILLIEDNEPNRHLMEDYLTYLGYRVMALADGSSFESALEEYRPHVILLDLKLPGIDGYAILERIRQRSDWRRIPVIVVSACAFTADQQRAIALGACRYLVKPIRLAELLDVIRDELEKPRPD